MDSPNVFQMFGWPKSSLIERLAPCLITPKCQWATVAKEAEALVSAVTNCKQLIDCLQITILPRSRVIRITLTDYVQR